MAKILCVDDERVELRVLESTLERAGHQTTGVLNVDAAIKVLDRGSIDLIVSDFRMPDRTGLDLLEHVQQTMPEVPLIVITGHASIEQAVQAIKAGARDYITKPVRAEQLQLAVEQALRFSELEAENRRLKDELNEVRQRREIIGESDAFVRVLETARMVAASRSTVLLQGETGTGKEVIARAIHRMSDRRDAPFVSVNCAALPESLIESSLFGHEKGAFTGASRRVKGAFERAHRGTILLDEISEMRQDLQAKLLRVLQEREFERVGGTEPVQVDVRVIATTNRDLSAAVRSGSFREDVYYRLSVIPLRLPPLRERREDIPLLAHHFALSTARDLEREVDGLAAEALERLQAYDWPGNVRELAHAVERAVILSRSRRLQPEDFERARFGLTRRRGEPQAGEPPGDAPLADGAVATLHSFDLDEAERVLIERALEETGQNRTRAAELLGISVRTLRYKLNRPDAD